MPTSIRRNLRGCYDAACERVDRLVERLHQGVADLQLTDIEPLGDATAAFRSNFERAAFEAAVERCKEYIFAGDIFQVVLSQRLQTETRARPFDIYRTLRVVNPSPFLFYLKSGPLCLVGSSPEIMARVEGDKVTIRPLAGTRRRGRNEEEDDHLAAELLADPKERAEHIMLVDLGRNDVGRVARYGTVQLSDAMSVERYSHVMHLCSTVTGRLQPGKTAFDALRSCLPAGTLSGAPKVRAMEIIDELEPHRRGPYGGAVGYIDFSGNMDTCIALRTLVLKGQTAYIQAAPASSPIASPPASTKRRSTRRADYCGRWRWRRSSCEGGGDGMDEEEWLACNKTAVLMRYLRSLSGSRWRTLHAVQLRLLSAYLASFAGWQPKVHRDCRASC